MGENALQLCMNMFTFKFSRLLSCYFSKISTKFWKLIPFNGTGSPTCIHLMFLLRHIHNGKVHMRKMDPDLSRYYYFQDVSAHEKMNVWTGFYEMLSILSFPLRTVLRRASEVYRKQLRSYSCSNYFVTTPIFYVNSGNITPVAANSFRDSVSGDIFWSWK